MDIIQNGGFELSGPGPILFTDWSREGTIGESNITHSGLRAAEFNASGDPSSIYQQVINAVPGAVYNLTFWINFDPFTASFIVLIDNVQVGPNFAGATVGYEQRSLNIVAPSNTFELRFTASVEDNFGLLDDVSAILTAGPCYHANSKILTRNSSTNEIETINAEDVISGLHEVFSVNDNKYIPVVHNIVSGGTNKFMLISKDSLGVNNPSQDFYITPTHPMIIDGKEVQARNVIGSIPVTITPSLLYSICTEKREPILINDLSVLSWSYQDWIQKQKQNKIIWHDNKKADSYHNL
jgi:hypothetical protein